MLTIDKLCFVRHDCEKYMGWTPDVPKHIATAKPMTGDASCRPADPTRRTALVSGVAATLLATGCAGAAPHPGQPASGLGMDVFNPALANLLDTRSSVARLADGFAWAEGPTWDRRRARLYFSDIPNNRIHIWSSETGLETFLAPAGRPSVPVDAYSSAGTNGILYQAEDDSLLICNQDGRSIDQLVLDTNTRSELVSKYEGKKLNSPNDMVRTRSGVLFFTDPPYGLRSIASDGIEQEHNGVYRRSPDGEVSLVTSAMTYPNGIALSPDERTLYVSQSDPDQPIIVAFDLDETARASNPRLWIDLIKFISPDAHGLPDGMAVDIHGNVFATGPGGVFIIAPSGEILGRIRTDRATANCAFGEDGRTLFMTAHQQLLSIRTQTIGLGFA